MKLSRRGFLTMAAILPFDALQWPKQKDPVTAAFEHLEARIDADVRTQVLVNNFKMANGECVAILRRQCDNSRL